MAQRVGGRWAWTVLVGLTIMAGSSLAAPPEPEGFKYPLLRAPRLAQPPVIDGKLDPAEWAGAAAFTGVTAEGSVGGHGSLVPLVQQVQWYLGYDDKYLYLAMRSPHPKGTYPVARVKEHDLIVGHASVLFEDHVEIQILTHGERAKATTQGKGFYKIMANPKAAVVDEYLFNGTVGTEQLWSMGGPLQCHVTPEAWELEAAVEIGRLKLDKLDGRDLVMQLVRTDSCTGMYFAGWVGAPWLDWQRFAQVSFAPDTPVCRFLQLGEIGAGELDAVVELVGGKQAADVEVALTVEDATGKVIHQDTRQVKLAAGATERLAYRKSGLPISKVAVSDRQVRNHFELKATAKIGKSTQVLYHNRSPFMQVDDEFRAQFLDKWIAGRPQSGEWEYKFSYLPYSDRLEASVDLDFFGVPAAVQAARAWRVKVLPQGQTQELASGGGEVAKLVGAPVLIALPKLAAGEYLARFELVGADGAVIATKEAPFVRKVYPWEHNRLGVSDEVIPPFKPLEVKAGNSIPYHAPPFQLYTGRQINEGIFMWGRIYTPAPNGLLAQIDTAPPSGTFGGAATLLASPMRFEVTQGGKVQPAKDGAYQIAAAAGHRVDLTGSQQAGPAQIAVKSFVEYDGWYEVEATVSGTGTIDAADLVIDLADSAALPIDTLYIQRLGDGRYGNHFGDLADRPGVLFKSTSLLKVNGSQVDWKSFVPRTYVGSGDRGLWFFAWSAAGWELRDEQPVIQVERLSDGNVRLRVRLLAGPVALDRPRTVRFALQAAPVKPNHPRYRTFNEEGLDVHDTRGYRYYGQSVDDFVNTRDEDYEALRQFVLYGQRYQGETQRTAKGNYRWWHPAYMEKLGHGAALTMYGSGQLTGMGPEEFKTFGGEWVGRSNWKPGRDAASDLGRWNYQGTTQWTADEQVSVTGMNWAQSAIDYFIWYHQPLMAKAGFNGTWWDNSSIGLVRDYNPALGRIEEVWVDYPRRQLVKRLNVLGWQLMRPPRWAANMHVDLGFAQTFWMVENDWYADGPDMTSLDQWPLGMFRSMARTKSTIQVARPWLRGFESEQPARDRQVKRSLWAMMASHDIHGALPGDLAAQRSLQAFRALVNLPDSANCLFAGYWLTGAMVQPAGKNVAASVYSNASLRSAAVLFFNGEQQGQYLAGTRLDLNALIPIRNQRLVAQRIYDLETGQEVPTVFEDGRYVVKAPLLVGGHDFRLLGVVAE